MTAPLEADKELDGILDDCTIALTSRTEGDTIITSFDERVVDVLKLQAALLAWRDKAVGAELEFLIEISKPSGLVADSILEERIATLKDGAKDE